MSLRALACLLFIFSASSIVGRATATGTPPGIGAVPVAHSTVPVAAADGTTPLQYQGGSVLSAPDGINIYFLLYGNLSSDLDQAAIAKTQAFAADLGGSNWWNTVTYYGDSTGAHISPKVNVVYTGVCGEGCYTTDQINAVDIITQMKAGAPNANDPVGLYTLIVPAGTNLTGPGMCKYWCGYHDYFIDPVSSVKIVYAVLPNCALCSDSKQPNTGLTTFFAHELAEAATDPYLDAWWGDSTSDDENADKCHPNMGFPDQWITANGNSYYIQQNWDIRTNSCTTGVDTAYNPCSPSPCSVNADCAVTDPIGVGQCTCKTNYIGDGKTCTYNPCLVSNGGCSASATCELGGITGLTPICTCNAGYSGDGKTCTNKCLISNGGCSASASCVLGGNDGATPVCTCKTNYIGDGKTCTYNPCLSNNGGCSSLATCTLGGTGGVTPVCTCKSGYSGDGKTCALTVTNPCQNNGGCSANATCSGNSTAICKCKSNYIGDGKTCVYNPCLVNNGGCSTFATCTLGGVTGLTKTCKCKTGYSGTGVTCKSLTKLTVLATPAKVRRGFKVNVAMKLSTALGAPIVGAALQYRLLPAAAWTVKLTGAGGKLNVTVLVSKTAKVGKATVLARYNGASKYNASSGNATFTIIL